MGNNFFILAIFLFFCVHSTANLVSVPKHIPCPRAVSAETLIEGGGLNVDPEIASLVRAYALNPEVHEIAGKQFVKLAEKGKMVATSIAVNPPSLQTVEGATYTVHHFTVLWTVATQDKFKVIESKIAVPAGPVVSLNLHRNLKEVRSVKLADSLITKTTPRLFHLLAASDSATAILLLDAEQWKNEKWDESSVRNLFNTNELKVIDLASNLSYVKLSGPCKKLEQALSWYWTLRGGIDSSDLFADPNMLQPNDNLRHRPILTFGFAALVNSHSQFSSEKLTAYLVSATDKEVTYAKVERDLKAMGLEIVRATLQSGKGNVRVLEVIGRRDNFWALAKKLENSKVYEASRIYYLGTEAPASGTIDRIRN